MDNFSTHEYGGEYWFTWNPCVHVLRIFSIINRKKKMVMMNETFLNIKIAICLIKLFKRSMGSIIFVFVSVGV